MSSIKRISAATAQESETHGADDGLARLVVLVFPSEQTTVDTRISFGGGLCKAPCTDAELTGGLVPGERIRRSSTRNLEPNGRLSLCSAVRALPNLTKAARARIMTAADAAAGLLITGERAVSRCFDGVKHRYDADFEAAMRSFLRAARGAKIDAQRCLFDAVAAEYQKLDMDANARSELLREVVLPFVEWVLPLRGTDDDMVWAELLTRVGYWEKGTDVPQPRSLALIISRICGEKGLKMDQLADEAGVGVN